jgi:hypothetical protein
MGNAIVAIPGIFRSPGKLENGQGFVYTGSYVIANSGSALLERRPKFAAIRLQVQVLGAR